MSLHKNRRRSSLLPNEENSTSVFAVFNPCGARSVFNPSETSQRPDGNAGPRRLPPVCCNYCANSQRHPHEAQCGVEAGHPPRW